MNVYHSKRRLLIALLLIGLLPSGGCETRQVVVRVVGLENNEPLANATVSHQRDRLTILGWWPRSIADNKVDAAGEVAFGGVRRNDSIVVSGDNNYRRFQPLWPDEELFRLTSRTNNWQASDIVWLRVMLEYTREARKALAPDDPRHLIVVPLLASEVQITSNERMEKLDPGVPVEQVELSGTRGVTDRTIALLKLRHPVIFAKVSHTHITDDGLVELASIPSLMALDLSTNWLITDAGVERVRALRPDLVIQSRVLTPLVEIDGDEATAALEVSSNLQRVHLMGEKNTDEGASRLGNHPALIFVTLTRTNITDDGLLKLASIPTVQSINLIGNAAITDAGIERAAALRNSLRVTRR